MMGYQFMRQKPIEKYIVDFFSSKLKLIIEVDGGSHYGKDKKDKKRQEELEQLGLSVLRFDDLDIKFKIGSKNMGNRNNPLAPFNKGDCFFFLLFLDYFFMGI